jgi:hypothetical protein
MHGTCRLSHIDNETAYLEGSAPVVTMRNYQKEVTAYTRAMASFSAASRVMNPAIMRQR